MRLGLAIAIIAALGSPSIGSGAMKNKGARSEHKSLPYRPLVPAAVAFATGVLLQEYAAIPRGVVWGVAAAMLAAHPLASVTGRGRLALATLYALLATAGWGCAEVAAGRQPGHHLAHLLGTDPRLVKLRGVVADDPQAQVLPPLPLSGDSAWLAKEAQRTRFDLAAEAVNVDGQWLAACGRVRVVAHAPPVALCYGDRVVVAGTARLPAPATNPGALDTARLLRRRGVHAVMSTGRGWPIVEQRGEGPWALDLIHAARARLRHVLRESLATSRQTAALLGAILLGDRTELDDELEESFKRSGTMHLLAISGLHVGVLAWVVWHVTALLGARRRVSGALVLCAVVAYALMTGAPPSVVRATVMTVAVVASILGKRQIDLLQSAALAALTLLIVRPFDLFHVGFQLSFAAVVAIVCLNEDLRALLGPRQEPLERLLADTAPPVVQRVRRGLGRWALNAFSVSLAAWLGVVPLTAYYFHLFSPVTVLCNLLAVPLVGLLVVVGFVHVGLAAVSGWLAAVPGWAAQGLTAALGWVVRTMQSVPLAWTYCEAPALGWVIAYYALGLVVVARRRIGLSGSRAVALWIAGLAIYLVATTPERRPAGMEMTVLDVQHGHAVLLRYPDGSTLVCDCGSYGRSDVGRWAMAPALWRAGVRRIDLLAVSHADADHINGVPALLERFEVGHVVYSPVVERSAAGRQLLAMLDRRGIPRRPATGGDRIEVGNGNVVEVLAPLEWTRRLCEQDQNENSLVLRVGHAGRRILLAGDIQDAATTALLRSGLDLRADVLLVPHHGRAMPCTPALACAVRPAYALCSNHGEQLPPETVEAYEKAGATVLATCWHGAVTVRTHGDALDVAPFLGPRRSVAPGGRAVGLPTRARAIP